MARMARNHYSPQRPGSANLAAVTSGDRPANSSVYAPYMAGWRNRLTMW